MPELPDPSWRVLANVVIGGEGDTPRWWIWDEEEAEFVEELHSYAHMDARVLNVIPHRLNDARAVELIKILKEAADADA